MTKTYKSLLVEERDKQFYRNIASRDISSLPAHEVLVKVYYSALNYKDALSATGNKGVTRNYPHTPGIDAAGIVEESRSPLFKAGEEVIVTSYDLGMNTPGGFSEYIRVPASWVVKKPFNLSLKECMILGTAGFTAALALYKMEINGQAADKGPILVTGATGGVGSMAVGILSKAGYPVIAATGKSSEADYLKELGASTVISREDVMDTTEKPMLKGLWAGVIDTVGGSMLETAIRSCGPNGNIAVCGLVASPKLSITVFPLIIRGVNILGVESAETPMHVREEVWKKLANEWKIEMLESVATTISMEEIEGYIHQILEGKTRGRIIVKIAENQ